MSNKKILLEDKITFGKYKGLDLKTLIEEDHKYVVWALRNIDWFDIDKEAEEYLNEVFEGMENMNVAEWEEYQIRILKKKV